MTTIPKFKFVAIQSDSGVDDGGDMALGCTVQEAVERLRTRIYQQYGDDLNMDRVHVIEIAKFGVPRFTVDWNFK